MVTRTYTPYFPGEKSFPKLTERQKMELFDIQPSVCDELEQRPCRVVLEGGEVVNNVCIAEAETYIKLWGVWPEDDPGKKAVDISKVVDIKESPNRLPAYLSNKLYSAGETAMGGIIFTVLFADESEQVYEYGNALDFIDLPEGKTVSDIIDVIPHKGRESANKLLGPEFYWCLYDK